MIIFRYLSRQIFQVTAAVTLVLLFVALTSRFLQYLGDAVAGKLTSEILLLLIIYRLPDFMLVILPFALFLAILLAYGRMYAENEMTVLSACGFSRRKLLLMTLVCSTAIAGVAGVFSLQLGPWGLQKTEQLKQSQDELTELDLIVAGQFQEFSRGQRITYAESIFATDAGRQLNNTFVALRGTNAAGSVNLRIIVSENARPVIEESSGRRFMLLENGYFYDGSPGQADYQITRFQEQSLLLPEQANIAPVVKEKALPSSELWRSDETGAIAEWQWRISVILLIPILTVIAVPMSKVDPRQGRFGKLIPAAIIYAVYYILLQLAMTWVEDGLIPPFIGLWWVHLLFLSGGIWLMSGAKIYKPNLARKRHAHA
jgi:lipopolysaccharide export system permease protein